MKKTALILALAAMSAFGLGCAREEHTNVDTGTTAGGETSATVSTDTSMMGSGTMTDTSGTLATSTDTSGTMTTETTATTTSGTTGTTTMGGSTGTTTRTRT